MKGISLITNFGCDTNCWYCIWRGHPLEGCSSFNIDWKKFKAFLEMFPQDKISISGGGDPLQGIEINPGKEKIQSWWKVLFAVCNKYNTKVDIHTSKLYEGFDDKINKLVLHVDYDRFFGSADYLENRFKDCPGKLRLVAVATPMLIVSQLEEMIKFANDFGCQLSIREWVTPDESLHGWNDDMYAVYEKIKENENKYIRYVDQADYNTYYMPDNNIYTDFFCENRIA